MASHLWPTVEEELIARVFASGFSNDLPKDTPETSKTSLGVFLFFDFFIQSHYHLTIIFLSNEIATGSLLYY